MILLIFLITILIFINFGITQIITQSILFKPLRNLNSLFNTFFSCILCISTWVGFILSYYIFSICDLLYNVTNPFITAFLDGMLHSGLVWIIFIIEDKLSR